MRYLILLYSCGIPGLSLLFNFSILSVNCSVPINTSAQTLFKLSYSSFKAAKAGCFMYSASSKIKTGSLPSSFSFNKVLLIKRILADLVLLMLRSEEHTSELQSRGHLVCRLLLEKKNKLVI